MSTLSIKVTDAVLAVSEPDALRAAVARATRYVHDDMGEMEVRIHPSARASNTNFLEWGLDVYKDGKRMIYLGMIQRHLTAPFEFHS